MSHTHANNISSRAGDKKPGGISRLCGARLAARQKGSRPKTAPQRQGLKSTSALPSTVFWTHLRKKGRELRGLGHGQRGAIACASVQGRSPQCDAPGICDIACEEPCPLMTSFPPEATPRFPLNYATAKKAKLKTSARAIAMQPRRIAQNVVPRALN